MEGAHEVIYEKYLRDEMVGSSPTVGLSYSIMKDEIIMRYDPDSPITLGGQTISGWLRSMATINAADKQKELNLNVAANIIDDQKHRIIKIESILSKFVDECRNSMSEKDIISILIKCGFDAETLIYEYKFDVDMVKAIMSIL